MGRFWVGLVAVATLGCSSAVAGPLPEVIWGDPSCGLPEAERFEKRRLLEASATDPQAAEQYRALIGSHAQQLQACRAQTWPRTQAVWLRLYDTDVLPGVLDEVLDRILTVKPP